MAGKLAANLSTLQRTEARERLAPVRWTPVAITLNAAGQPAGGLTMRGILNRLFGPGDDVGPRDLDLVANGHAHSRASVDIGGRGLSTHYLIECFDRHGNLKWVDEFDNLVVTAGLNDSLNQHFKGSSYTAAWYVGLTAGTPTFAAGDTMSSHAGWTEVTAYDESVRQTLTLGTVAAGSVDNSAAKATFTIATNSTTIGGLFLTTVSTKGGSTGTLYGGGAFSAGNKVLDDNDTLQCTVTLTATAS
jgi:hypothetical protein